LQDSSGLRLYTRSWTISMGGVSLPAVYRCKHGKNLSKINKSTSSLVLLNEM
jgi:hypothetical protein